MKEFIEYLWSRRTTTFGYVQGVIAAAVVIPGLIPAEYAKWFMLANAMLLGALGHYNNHAINR